MAHDSTPQQETLAQLTNYATCRVIAYLQEFADKRKLQYKQDSTGNMVIIRPGTGGGEAAPTVVIQV